MTKTEVLELIKEAKELGVSSLKVDGVEIEFSREQSADIPKKKVSENETADLQAKDLVAPPSPFDILTDQEILFWSCGYGVELEEQRKNEQKTKEQREKEDAERKETAGISFTR